MRDKQAILIMGLLIAAIIGVLIWLYKKKSKPSVDFGVPDFDDPLIDQTGTLPAARTPTSRDIERRAAEVLDKPIDVWDAIDRYTQAREAEATTRTVTKEEPAQTTREESFNETLSKVSDPEVASVVNQACPTVVWRVKYFDKDSRVWEYRYVKAVTSHEAIAAVKPTVNGGLFSADKTA